jgi:hypothetical protein
VVAQSYRDYGVFRYVSQLPFAGFVKNPTRRRRVGFLYKYRLFQKKQEGLSDEKGASGLPGCGVVAYKYNNSISLGGNGNRAVHQLRGRGNLYKGPQLFRQGQ